MSAQDARREISYIVTSMLGSGLAVDSNPPVSYRTATHTHVVWPSVAPIPPVPFASVAGYRCFLENRQYNLLLLDGALLQASLTFHRDQLVKQSLCYYPCPVSFPPQEDPAPLSIIESIDEILFNAIERLEWLIPLQGEEPHATEPIPQEYSLRMRAPLRFDYDPASQGPLHPAAHLHLGDQNCRIPVYAPMSFVNFVRFIFRHYYRDGWLSHAFLMALPARSPARCILREDETELFLECLP